MKRKLGRVQIVHLEINQPTRNYTMTKQKITLLVLVLLCFGTIFYLFKDQLAPPKEQRQVDNEALLAAYFEPVEPVLSSALPTIEGVSTYRREMRDGKLVVKFPINIWGGWTPLIVANGGLRTTPDSIFGRKGLAVDLIINDSSVDVMRGFASGNFHVLWATLDMVALYAPALSVDSRTAPVVSQILDWSNGGDGVVARNGITRINDLGTPSTTGGKRRIVLAENSPSQFLMVSLLLTAGVDINSVEFVYARDPIAAARLYVQNPDIDAFVGWAPQIYELPDLLPCSRLIITTSTANRWLAGVYAWRNDFFQDNRQIVTDITDGLFEAMEVIRNPERHGTSTQNIWRLFADTYGLDIADAEAMIGNDGMIFDTDAHLTNFRGNVNFFRGTGGANFATIWNRANNVWLQLGVIQNPVAPERVKNTSILDALEHKWQNSIDLSQREFNPTSVRLLAESEAVGKRAVIAFRPNSIEVCAEFDPTVPETMTELSEMIAGFGYAMIVLEGHVDGSNRGIIPADDARFLSEQRAEAVKRYLVANYDLQADQIRVIGKGWSNPLPGFPNMDDPEHRRMNRRVEIKIFTIESE